MTTQIKKRALSDEFMHALKSGVLKEVLQAVKDDDTLCIELRGNAINIYYRGGSLFCIEEKINASDISYQLKFDMNYDIRHESMLSANPSVEFALKNIPFYKQAMDYWFSAHPKTEREYQQTIVRENNFSNIAGSTDYYIVDIEYVCNNDVDENGEAAKGRFDLVAIKWPSTGASRKNTSKPTLSLMEMKYGDGSLNGNAGIIKHLNDFDRLLKETGKIAAICDDMSKVFLQKCQLGLIKGIKETQYEIKINPSIDTIETIFLFTNHDPDKTALKRELTSVDTSSYNFPINAAIASPMGFGLYKENIIPLDCFRNSLKK